MEEEVKDETNDETCSINPKTCDDGSICLRPFTVIVVCLVARWLRRHE